MADPRPARETREILDRLESQHPGADTELHYRTAFELLIATILSAQSTDARVNIVTPSLFAKARSISGAARALVERHDGEVPASMDALVELPGVGRKTANVVLGHALGVPGLPVDRHVLRVANRLGIAASDEPETVEKQLAAALPKARWTRASDTLILHGRRVCRPTPMCDRCAARDLCRYFKTLGQGRSSRSGSRRATKSATPSPTRRPRR